MSIFKQDAVFDLALKQLGEISTKLISVNGSLDQNDPEGDEVRKKTSEALTLVLEAERMLTGKRNIYESFRDKK